MKILVTGASGFIGSHVIDNLLAQGHKVIAFDHKQDYRFSDNKNVEFFLGDIRDETSVFEAVALSDGVIHLAGVLGTQETVNNPKPAFETNVFGGLNVFQALRAYKVPAVYIAVGNHFENNPYSISKTTAERLALMFNKIHKTKIAIVRGLNAYGPRQKASPVRKIMPNFVIPALQGGLLRVYGDGEQIMDMIYVEDLAEILVRALLVEHNIYDKVFEAGTGIKTTVNEIADEVIKQAGKSGAKSPQKEYVPMRPGETPGVTVLGNPATLKPLFDGKFPALHSLESGVHETISWYSENL